MNRIFLIIIIIILNVSFISLETELLYARKVVCIDSGSGPPARGFLNNHEGWEWQNFRPGDLIVVGGRLDSCMKRLNNGDTLVIVTHSPDTVGGSFVWGGARYNGFGTGAGKYPVPPGFDTLRNIHTKFCSCFSAKDPAGADTPLTAKIIAAMGGAGRGHTAEGFTGFAVASNRMTLRPKAGARQRDVDSATRVIQHPVYSVRWKSCPPVNRVPAPAVNQRTCAQHLIDSLVGAGKVNVIISGYNMPRNRPQTALTEVDTCFICECFLETDSLCGCAPLDLTECEICAMYGPNSVNVNELSVLYEAFSTDGTWSINNTPPCNATFSGSNTGDSIYINTGDFPGTFELCLSITDTCGDSACCIQITVEKPLPVELLSFTSFVSENNVLLHWKTESEINNSGFVIERAAVSNENPEFWINAGFAAGNGTIGTVSDYYFTDRNLNSGRYKYRLKQLDYNGIFSYFNLEGEINIGSPEKYSLSQNYPNPFNPETKINYDIAQDGIVKIVLYDINGREITTLVNDFKKSGYYTLKFNAGKISGNNELSSGIYFYRLESGSFVSARKLVLLK